MSNGTQLFLDDCQRANENPLSDGGNWAVAGASYSNMKLASNLIQATATSTNCAMRLTTWASLGGVDDQYIEVVMGHAPVGADLIHVWLRSDSNRQNCYLLKITTAGNALVAKIVAGAQTNLLTGLTVGTVAGDRVRFMVVGSQITVYLNQQWVATTQDAAVTSGLPGMFINCSTLTNATFSQVRAGFPAGNVNGPWTKKGPIINATTADINSHLLFSGISNQTAMYDDNPQLISPNSDGKVFKIWFMAGNAITYAESTTALPGSWTRTAVASLASRGLPRVYRDGSTYYAYVSHAPTTWTHVDVYTCTNGDNNWVLAQADVLVSGGTYDAQQAAYLSVVGNIGGTWYALYNALSNTSVFSMCLVTASSLTGVWTKYAGNPVYSLMGCPEHMVQLGGYYYGWLAHVTGASSNIVRLRTADFITWDSKVTSLQPENSYEGINTQPSARGSISVPSVVEANGSCYQFYSSTSSDATPAVGYLINVAVAPYTMAQLITTGEEYFANQPASFTDTFQRANVSPLGAPYTAESGSNGHQIVSHLVEATVVNAQSRSAYSDASPALSNDQFTEITIATLNAPSGNTCFTNPLARMALAAVTHYGLTVGGPTGSAYNINISRIVAGSGTQIGPNMSRTVSVGDVFRLRAITIPNNGELVSAYQNDNLILEITDYNTSPIVFGYPGFGSFCNTGAALTDSQISQFRAGNADVAYALLTVATPSISPNGGSFNVPTLVTLSDTDSALLGFAMYYTTDGSVPTTASTLYTAPFSISGSKTVKVLAVATGYSNSAVAQATFTVVVSGGLGFKFDYGF